MWWKSRRSRKKKKKEGEEEEEACSLHPYLSERTASSSGGGGSVCECVMSRRRTRNHHDAVPCFLWHPGPGPRPRAADPKSLRQLGHAGPRDSSVRGNSLRAPPPTRFPKSGSFRPTKDTRGVSFLRCHKERERKIACMICVPRRRNNAGIRTSFTFPHRPPFVRLIDFPPVSASHRQPTTSIYPTDRSRTQHFPRPPFLYVHTTNPRPPFYLHADRARWQGVLS
jgi:hypothetical protein